MITHTHLINNINIDIYRRQIRYTRLIFDFETQILTQISIGCLCKWGLNTNK